VLSAPADYVPGTIFMACAGAGYVGLVRLEDGSLNIAGALDAGEVRRLGGVGPAAVAVIDKAGLPPVPGLAEAAWRGTPPLTRHAGRAAAERVFLLGDAAGYVEPFTGEGIAWALACGAAIAPLAHRACLGWTDALAREWSGHYRRTVSRRQWACRAIAWMLRSPLIVSTGIKLFRRAPLLFAPLLHFLDGPAVRRYDAT
jgi:2-polyprenyl-6-methoxyphenol hydroxylase-like FAD-dependent oxidoreductase